MLDRSKPHMGTFKKWAPVPSTEGLGYYLVGIFHGHPRFNNESGNISSIVAVHPEINEVETLHSRYSLEEPSVAEGIKKYELRTE